MSDVTIDDLAQQYADDDDCYNDINAILDLARCVMVNLDNIRPIAEANPMIGVVWGQAKGLCLVIEKFAAREASK